MSFDKHLTSAQREFIMSNEPRLCFQASGPVGKTHALILAAARVASEGGKALLVAGCDDAWTAFNKQLETLMEDVGIPRVPKRAWEWRTGAGTIKVTTLLSEIHQHGFDFIGIDNSEQFSVKALAKAESHLSPTGILRMVRDETRLNALIGKRIGP